MSRSVSRRSSPRRPPIRATLSRAPRAAAPAPPRGGLGRASAGGPLELARRRARGTAVARWRASSRVLAAAAAHELDGERAQPLEALPLLGRLLGGEQRAAAHAEALDQRCEEDVGLDRVELRRRATVQLDEALDPFARLRRHLRRLAGGASPTTRSSLRRRATWITRARSTWRSSIGGRVSARTTADASRGSTSSRIHASTSRTSARLRKRPSASAPAVGLATAGRRFSSQARSKDTRAADSARLRSGGGPDRLGHGAAGRRADRRLPARTAACAPTRSSRSRTTSPPASATYSGLPLPGDLPPLEMVDRPAWIAANLRTMRPMLAPLSERMGDQRGILSVRSARSRGCCSARRSER